MDTWQGCKADGKKFPVACSTIEQAFGLLKNHFRARQEFSLVIIMACCVLHNITLDQDADFPIDVEDSSYGDSKLSKCTGTAHSSCYQVFSNSAFIAYFIL